MAKLKERWQNVQPLNERQIQFAHEFVKSGNATQSAIRAGYTRSNACSIAARLVQHPLVQELIAELNEKLRKDHPSCLADATEVQAFLTQCIRGEVQEEAILPGKGKDGEPTKVMRTIPGSAQVKAAELLARILQMTTLQESEVKVTLASGIELGSPKGASENT